MAASASPMPMRTEASLVCTPTSLGARFSAFWKAVIASAARPVAA